jgi:hypothetical protein
VAAAGSSDRLGRLDPAVAVLVGRPVGEALEDIGVDLTAAVGLFGGCRGLTWRLGGTGGGVGAGWGRDGLEWRFRLVEAMAGIPAVEHARLVECRTSVRVVSC